MVNLDYAGLVKLRISQVVLADVCSLRGRILSDFGDIVTFL